MVIVCVVQEDVKITRITNTHVYHITERGGVL